jgi:hypothetical protein
VLGANWTLITERWPEHTVELDVLRLRMQLREAFNGDAAERDAINGDAAERGAFSDSASEREQSNGDASDHEAFNHREESQ